MLHDAKYDQMGLEPSFDEAQDQWIADGLMKRKMPRLPALKAAPKSLTQKRLPHAMVL